MGFFGRRVLGFQFQGLGFSSGFRAQGVRFTVLKVMGFGFMVWVLGLRF